MDDEQMMKARDTIVPLLMTRDRIYKDTMLWPKAVMLPAGLIPEGMTVYGMTVVPGDRAALLYEGRA